jgi:hypothetical protein
MKKLPFALCLSLVVAASVVMMARGDQDFDLINRTGLTITSLYVSPANDNHWGPDILGRDVMKNGESATIKFPKHQDACMWDLKIDDEEGDSVVWEDIDLCKAEEITLKYEGKHPTAVIK